MSYICTHSGYNLGTGSFSPRKIPWRSIQVLFIPFSCWVVFHGEGVPQFVHTPVWGCLGWFYLLAVANKAAVNMSGKTCTWTYSNFSGINVQKCTGLSGKYYHSFYITGEGAKVRGDDLTKSTQWIGDRSDWCLGLRLGSWTLSGHSSSSPCLS